MKKGDKILFRETVYGWNNGNRVRIPETQSEKITEGTIVCKDGKGWMVKTATPLGIVLPTFVTAADIVEDEQC